MTGLIAATRRPGQPAHGNRVEPGLDVSRTAQTAQSDQSFEKSGKLRAVPGRKPTAAPSKLTIGQPRWFAWSMEVMNAAPVVDAVRRAGGKLALRGERIRLTASEPLPDALIAEVRRHKTEILDLLRSGTPPLEMQRSRVPSPMAATSDVRDWQLGVERLSLMPTPQHYPELAWKQFITDAERFLERWGVQSARLGWRSWEVFGCCRPAPWARIQGMGLVLLLRGHAIAALTATEAVTRTSTGAHQTYRRKCTDPLHPAERCLAWELEAPASRPKEPFNSRTAGSSDES